MVIRGGRVVDPVQGIDALRDVRATDVVVEIGEHLEPLADETVIDATGTVVAPGFIDMHVHLREPGNPEKETIESGTEAAVRGGFTAVACMPNTVPALDDASALANLRAEIAKRARCRVYAIGAMTRGRAGEERCDFTALAAAGAVGFSDDGDSVADARVLYGAAVAAADVGAVFISHCEDATLKPLDAQLAESAVVARDLLIAAATGKTWHVAHLSLRASVELLHLVRSLGARATAEVTPHHLACTQERARDLGPAGAVNPPLRSERDARALRDAVRDGTIDVFASDHAPHTQEQKRAGAPGFTGLEIALGAYAAAIPDLPLARFVALLSSQPARVLGVPGGTLRPGSPADLTLFADRQWRVDASRFASFGRTTPFDGAVFARRAVTTIVGGEVRYRA